MPVLDQSTRIRLASFFHKLAIRTQQVAFRPVDPGQAIASFDRASNGSLKKLVAFLFPENLPRFKSQNPAKPKSPPPSILADKGVRAARSFIPNVGEAIRVEFIFGPIYLTNKTEQGLGVLTSQTIHDMSTGPYYGGTVLSTQQLEKVLADVFGGSQTRTKIIATDARRAGDRKYKVVRDFANQRWRIIDVNTGETAYYESVRVKDEDPLRPAVFESSEEALKVFNDLTRGVALKTRSLPQAANEFTIYIKYSTLYPEASSDRQTRILFAKFDELLGGQPSPEEDVSLPDIPAAAPNAAEPSAESPAEEQASVSMESLVQAYLKGQILPEVFVSRASNLVLSDEAQEEINSWQDGVRTDEETASALVDLYAPAQKKDEVLEKAKERLRLLKKKVHDHPALQSASDLKKFQVMTQNIERMLQQVHTALEGGDRPSFLLPEWSDENLRQYEGYLVSAYELYMEKVNELEETGT